MKITAAYTICIPTNADNSEYFYFKLYGNLMAIINYECNIKNIKHMNDY